LSRFLFPGVAVVVVVVVLVCCCCSVVSLSMKLCKNRKKERKREKKVKKKAETKRIFSGISFSHLKKRTSRCYVMFDVMLCYVCSMLSLFVSGHPKWWGWNCCVNTSSEVG